MWRSTYGESLTLAVGRGKASGMAIAIFQLNLIAGLLIFELNNCSAVNYTSSRNIPCKPQTS
jgi:hypothetical protein